MKRISPERKSAILAKLLPSYNMAISTVAQMEGISEATFCNWCNQVKQERKPVPGVDKNSEQWPAEARFAAIVKTATLPENEEHRHSGIRYVMPAERHRRENRAPLKQRYELYRQAQKAHPKRWSGRTRNW